MYIKKLIFNIFMLICSYFHVDILINYLFWLFLYLYIWPVRCTGKVSSVFNSRTTIKLITEPVDEWHHYAVILNNIKDILNRDWHVSILHTLREGNTCADYLAKHGANNNEVFSSIAIPPAGLNLFLLADACGTSFLR
jgi:hypothetical protein